jgi:vancomycin resistance protein YoaR
VAVSSSAVRGRGRARARRRRLTTTVAGAAVVLVVGTGVAVFFAGSGGKLAPGTRIAGVAVGGLSPAEARDLLERRAAQLTDVPVTFVVGSRRFRLTPKELDVHVDWAAAVAAAQQRGDGFAPIRGFRRLRLRFSPIQISPQPGAYDAGLSYELDRIARAVDRPHREAHLVRIGLQVAIVRGATGTVLDRAAARRTLVDALASFDRAPVALPVRTDPPRVGVADLTSARRIANRVLAAPVTLALGKTRWRVPRYRLAPMLELPASATQPVRLGGQAADDFFHRLSRSVASSPRDADWAPTAGGGIRLVPAQPGVALDVAESARRLLAAAERTAGRVATLAVATEQPSRSTTQAAAMGIDGVVGTYETFYGGDPNRIHNVQLVAHLVDRKLIAPGSTFSFNQATGERTAAKGFLQAPVIINGEVQTGLGGGVCQVSTTVFNAAYEAGLRITDRTNHALYISHYPLGRDATVDYPDIDLKFVNDTGHWLLLRTFVGSSSLVVTLYGTPQHRRVETESAPLTVVAQPPVERTKDPALPVGKTTVIDPGVPATTTSVHRRVYDPSGKLLSDETWVSNYRSEPRVLDVGTRKAKKPKAAATVTTSTTTEPTPPPRSPR